MLMSLALLVALMGKAAFSSLLFYYLSSVKMLKPRPLFVPAYFSSRLVEARLLRTPGSLALASACLDGWDAYLVIFKGLYLFRRTKLFF